MRDKAWCLLVLADKGYSSWWELLCFSKVFSVHKILLQTIFLYRLVFMHVWLCSSVAHFYM